MIFFLEETESDNEYLELVLRPDLTIAPNKSDLHEINFIRQSIQTSFKSTKCFRLPIPVVSASKSCGLCSTKVEPSQEELLQKLDTIPYKELKETFKEKMDKMCLYVKDKVDVKTVNSIPLNGPLFIKYLEEIIEKLNNNEVIYLSESLTVAKETFH